MEINPIYVDNPDNAFETLLTCKKFKNQDATYMGDNISFLMCALFTHISTLIFLKIAV